MTEIKKNERYIPTKNYIIAFGVVIGILLLVWYCFAWYKVYKEDKVSTSYLIKNNIISNEQSFDSIVHNENKNNALENNDVNNKNEELNKKISGLNNTSSFDKYSQRIEFTK